MPPELPRLIVLDEDINWKLARELRRRGLNATSVFELGLAGRSIKDGMLIKALHERREPLVLVAWDNKMPRSHAGQLRHFGTTLAVIDKYSRRGLDEESYYRDVIHRHAHRIAKQPAASIYKYTRTRRAALTAGATT